MARSLESVIVTQCAPTLAGIKPASLFRYNPSSLSGIRQIVRHWDSVLTRSGLRMRLLKVDHSSGCCLLYVCRPDWVARLLKEEESLRFLECRGYRGGDVDDMLSQLSRRFYERGDFPHEIGIFLGYPLEDVVGFIENRGQNYTFCGCWKSYGDPERARAYFDLCRRCTDWYCRHFEQGVSLQRLVVAA